jgi:HEAT repeat protein
MPDTDIQQKALDVLVHMHTTIKNVQLYPPVSPTITASIERLYIQLLDFLKRESPLVFAESERKALLRGKVLNQKDQGAVHIASLLRILLNCGITSISFDKGLGKEELGIFIKIIARNADSINAEGGLFQLMTDNKIEHIYLDEKVFVSMDKDQKITSELEINDDKDSQQNISVISTAEIEKSAENIAVLENTANQLTEKLLSENTETRAQASSELAAIIESLPLERQNELVGRLLIRLTEWIKQETSVITGYKKMCFHLQLLIQDFIFQERFSEIVPIIDVFSAIDTGALEKNDHVREISREVLSNLASDYNVNILLKELNTNHFGKEKEAGRILAGFGESIINKLLELVRTVTDSNERVRVIHLILGVGQRAIPAIKNHINSNAPWYYLRNLAYLLGHIGNEATVQILKPLLLHKNDKVRMEALKSVYQTGGHQRGPLLLSVLPQASDALRVNIIEMLGKLKYANAVPDLIDILNDKSLISKDEHISMQEKVCEALGIIGSPEAVKPLSEIAESKSFLGIGSYPVKIKYAAKRALDSIRRKQTEKV